MIPKHVLYVLKKHGVRVLGATKRNHLKITCEKGGETFKIVTASTPSCPFALKHFEKDLVSLLDRKDLYGKFREET